MGRSRHIEGINALFHDPLRRRGFKTSHQTGYVGFLIVELNARSKHRISSINQPLEGLSRLRLRSRSSSPWRCMYIERVYHRFTYLLLFSQEYAGSPPSNNCPRGINASRPPRQASRIAAPERRCTCTQHMSLMIVGDAVLSTTASLTDGCLCFFQASRCTLEVAFSSPSCRGIHDFGRLCGA